MDITAINKYLQSAPRYRLVVLKDEMPPDDIPKFDIGKSISAYIISENLLHSKDLKMLVNAEFMRLFQGNSQLTTLLLAMLFLYVTSG